MKINWAQPTTPAGKKVIFMLPPALGFATLLVASILQDVYMHYAGLDANSKIWILDVDCEESIYTWASSCLIALNAVLLFLIAVHSSKNFFYWFFLSVTFAAVSLDESLSFHERLSLELRNLLDTGGVFYFAWVMPAAIACLAGFLLYCRFLQALPKATAALFLCSAAIFLSGAIGLEMFGGYHAELGGFHTPAYRALVNAEEGLEGAGMILFLYALIDYIGRRNFFSHE